MHTWQQLYEFVTSSRVGARLGRAREWLRYDLRSPRGHREFWIVSCARNAGVASIQCLDSVYSQDYDRTKVTHLFVDDASTDGTESRVREWLVGHPDHSVRYVRNDRRLGGSANTVAGLRSAPPGSIVVELNGDDWLPDPGVLPFLNRVYAADDVWMTYNSYRFSDPGSRSRSRPVPPAIVRSNGFRDYRWVTQHLHTFRAELFAHVEEEDLVDPRTGAYWESADDQAIYLAMLELAGTRSRHIYRTMCVFNPTASFDPARDREGSKDREARIRGGRRYRPLRSLTD